MTKRALGLVLLLASVGTSGCAALLSPYGQGYRPYPGRRPQPYPVVDPDTAARGRWDQVMRLPHGATIDVLMLDGVAHVGTISGANGDSVHVLVGGMEDQIARADVLRVDLVDLPGSELAAVAKRTVRGATLGMGVSALVGAVVGGGLWPPPAPLVRAGAAIGGVSGAQAALASRQGRIIYLAEDQRPRRRQPDRPGGSDDERDREAAERHALSALMPGMPPRFAGPASAPIHAMPSQAGGPPPGLSQRPLVVAPGRGGPAICHSHGVPISRR